MFSNGISEQLTGEASKFMVLVLTGAFCYLFSTGNCFVKSISFKICFLIISGVCMPIFLLRPRDPKNMSIMSALTAISRWFFGIKMEIRGSENLARDRSGVIVVNHQSMMDALAITELSAVIGKVVPVMKRELLPLFPFGPALWLCGAVFIARNKPEHAYKSLKDAQNRVFSNQGSKIVFYPEGTRNINVINTGKLLPFKRGAFRTAIACQVPIFPIVNAPYYFHTETLFGKGTIITEILPPIETKGLTEDDIDDLMEKTAIVMQDTFDKLHKEVMESLPKKYRELFKSHKMSYSSWLFLCFFLE